MGCADGTRGAREVLKDMDEVVNDIHQERTAEGTVEQSDDLLVPQVMECVAVVKIIAYERSTERIVAQRVDQ